MHYSVSRYHLLEFWCAELIVGSHKFYFFFYTGKFNQKEESCVYIILSRWIKNWVKPNYIQRMPLLSSLILQYWWELEYGQVDFSFPYNYRWNGIIRFIILKFQDSKFIQDMYSFITNFQYNYSTNLIIKQERWYINQA